MIRAKVAWPPGSKVLVDLGLLLAALVAASLMLTAKPAHAATTFTVNDTGDLFDHNVGDGVCDFTISEGDRCSLRAAIQEANHPNNPGPDTIRFNIPGSGVKTIRPVAELPGIKEQVTIDGYTQPGSKKNTLAKGTNAVPLIELDGSNASSGTHGLVIRDGASNSEIRGLVINRFNQGIVLSGGFGGNESGISGVEIEGNFIGTDATGQGDLGNSGAGVFLFGTAPNRVTDNTIGGTEPEARNLISGSGSEGSSSGDGVVIFGAGNNKVEGNLIGTKKDGTSPLGNAGDGVSIVEATGNSVGGALLGAANTIAFNDGNGVAVNDVRSAGNSILRNSIFSNGDLGIDLAGLIVADGRTLNDPKDPDAGPNTLQNFPVLTSAVKASGGKTTIKGRINSTPNKEFAVQFYSNPQNGDEGKTFLGQKRVTTNSNGNVTFSFATTKPVPVGGRITATANDLGGNTSEFSDPVKLVRP